MDLLALIDILFDYLKSKYKSYLPFKGFWLDQFRNFLKDQVRDLARVIREKQSFQGIPPTDIVIDLHKH